MGKKFKKKAMFDLAMPNIPEGRKLCPDCDSWYDEADGHGCMAEHKFAKDGTVIRRTSEKGSTASSLADTEPMVFQF